MFRQGTLGSSPASSLPLLSISLAVTFTQVMATFTRDEAEAKVRSWGFSHVFTWTDRTYVIPPTHPLLPTPLLPATIHSLIHELHHSSFMRIDSNAYYSPHTHGSLTTHLILRGALTISYPDDARPSKETFGPGARVDVDARRRHEVWMGQDGCEYVIGE